MRWFAGSFPKFFDQVPHTDLDRERRAVADVLVRTQVDVVKGTARFVHGYKRQLRRAGAVDFDLPRGAELPPWMAVVLETLRLRGRSWRVVTMRGPRGGKRFRVQWLGWGKFTLRGRR